MTFPNPNLERGKLLFEQNRFEQALQALQQALADNPDDDEALLYQCYALMQLDRNAEALELANRLLQQQPDNPYLLNLKAKVLSQLKRGPEALALVEEAIQQLPDEETFWATACALHFDQKDYEKALEAATEGLRLDPSNTVCLNIRTLTLTKLHRTDELASAIEETLAEDPGDAFSHASAGWALLEAGNHKQARVHFAEALRIAPGLKWAEQGMLQAIKAKNVVYRFFLKYYFWSSNLKSQNQWLLIIGIYFLTSWLDKLENPTILVTVGQVLLVGFIWLTWFIDPLFNVMMLFDKDGRHLLSDRQRDRYRYVAAMLAFGVPISIMGFAMPSRDSLVLFMLFGAGLVSLGLVLPLSGWIEVDQEKNRNRMRWVFGIMAATGGLSVLLMPFSSSALTVLSVFFYELIAFMFFRNYLLIQEVD